MTGKSVKNRSSSKKTSAKTTAKKKSDVKAPLKAVTAVAAKPNNGYHLELTKNNHFRFGYDRVPFINRTSPEQRWSVEYGRCKRVPLDWRSECLIAAKEIRGSTQQDLYVCFSGGIDSQVVAEAFRFARIPFRAAILRFKKDLNIHDISWAVIYCETNGVPYEFFDVDIEEFFLGGELKVMADLTHCVTPQLPSSMKLMEMIAKKGGYPILGSAECYLEKTSEGWVMFEREKIAAVYRYLMATDTPGQAGFFQWNPEIMYSFLVDPMIRRLVSNRVEGHNSTYYLKSEIYENHFKLMKRPKYTGFEKIMALDRRVRSSLETKYVAHTQECYIPYAQLLKALAPYPKLVKVKKTG